VKSSKKVFGKVYKDDEEIKLPQQGMTDKKGEKGCFK